jgi:hypothetical protein
MEAMQMANKEHLARLKEGVDEWNFWIKEKRSHDATFRPQLGEADLAGMHLLGADLRHAILIQADLRGSNLGVAMLNEAILLGAKLNKSVLSQANLSRAIMNEADLGGAELLETNLSGAQLNAANLSGAGLGRADLTDTDLTDVRGLEVDSCRIVHTRFSPNANDKWSKLRRTYTGPKLVLNLLLMMLFFTPLIIKGASLTALGDAQHRVIEAINRVDNYRLKVQCTQPDGAIIGVVREREIRVPCRIQSVWKLLMGFGGPYGSFMPYLTAILIAYQFLRYWMTMQISAMREAEERSGISPPRDGLLSYRRLFWVHRLLDVIRLATLAALGLRAYEFLFANEVIFVGS